MSGAVSGLVGLPGDPFHILAATMSGGLYRIDLRALPVGGAGLSNSAAAAHAGGIVLSYEGHCNSRSLLRPSIDARGHLLAACGEDGRCRVWSLRAGGRPLAAEGGDGTADNPGFSTAFGEGLLGFSSPVLLCGGRQGVRLAA